MNLILPFVQGLPARITAFGVLTFGLLSAWPAESSWRPTGGPPGGDIHVLEAAGADLFAGTFNGGMYRSSDGGETWSSIGNLGWVKDLARQGDLIFAGSAGGFFRSEDRGATWDTLKSTKFPRPTNVDALAAQGGILFACVRQVGLARSLDSGATWTVINGNLPNSAFQAINGFYVHGSVIYGAAAGMMKSEDGGDTWTDLRGDMPREAISSIPKTPNIAYSAAADGSGLYVGVRSAVYRSTNGGVNWTRIMEWEPDNIVNTLAFSQGILYAGTDADGIWGYSPADGQARRVAPDLHYVRDLSVTDAGHIMAGTGNGIYRSMGDGGAWELKSTGLMNQIVGALAARGGDLYAAAYLPGVFRSSDQGKTWKLASSQLDGAGAQAVAVSGGTLFVGMRNSNGVHLSDDQGATWRKVSGGPVLDAVDVKYLYAPEGSGTVYAGTAGRGLFTSKDEGASWKAVTGLDLENQVVFNVAAGGAKIFIGTQGGLFVAGAAGDSVLDTALGNQSVLSLGGDGKRMFAGLYENGVRKSIDGGRTWTGTPMSHPMVMALVCDGDTVYAGTDGGGVFRSPDDGTTWQAFSQGGLPPKVLSLVMDRGRLYAGTSGGSVYVLDLEKTIGVGRKALGHQAWSRVWNSAGKVSSPVFKVGTAEPGRFLLMDARGRVVLEGSESGPSGRRP